MERKPLTSVEKEILVALLSQGNNIPSNLSEITERHPQSVQDRLAKLEGRGHVSSLGGGVYSLTVTGVRLAQEILRDSDEGFEVSIPDS